MFLIKAPVFFFTLLLTILFLKIFLSKKAGEVMSIRGVFVLVCSSDSFPRFFVCVCLCLFVFCVSRTRLSVRRRTHHSRAGLRRPAAVEPSAAAGVSGPGPAAGGQPGRTGRHR